LAEDAAGRIWVGTEGGLVFQGRDDRFVPVPLPGANPGESIQFIVPDGKDALWIGAMDGGLYHWYDGKVMRLPRDAGLPVNDLRSLLIDTDGDFWFGTGKGLFRVPRRDLEKALGFDPQSMRVTTFGRHDGLPSMEFSRGFRNAATQTHDGHLWFATSRGALEITPPESGEAALPLPPLIEGIEINGKSQPIENREKLILPPRLGPLQIHYTLPDMSSPERLRFRYRLVGFGDNKWVSAATERTANFSHLPPGDYRFEVVAAEGNGPWQSATASLRFIVLAAWWETAWFRLVAGLLVVLALIWTVRCVVRRRMRIRMRILEQENALERERTRIARDIHDELGANLTQIAISSKLAKLDPAHAVSVHIDEIATAARGTMESLDEIVWAINPRHDTLSSLVEYIGKFAVNFLTASGIACKLGIPENLPPRPLGSNVRHHLFLVVKEALNNAVKYAGAGAVRLEVGLAGDLLRVVVADDGCGFELGSERADGNGLRNMSERMAEAGGECRIESHIGEGTRVIFELPLTDG
jgi:signal transduction histidine kinase